MNKKCSYLKVRARAREDSSTSSFPASEETLVMGALKLVMLFAEFIHFPLSSKHFGGQVGFLNGGLKKSGLNSLNINRE